MPSPIAPGAVEPAPPSRALPGSFSVYLDLIRWVAATCVMLFHLRENGFGSHWINAHLPSNGHAYVTIFFVLSGFVISFTNDRKKHLGAREYVKDRAARIYSVALPVLLLCFLASLLFEPGNLRNEYAFALQHPIFSALVNSFFVGNVWFVSLPPYLDDPYWSLSYEVIYYAAFGLWVFSKHRVWWLLALAILAGPKIWLLFPCWLAGVLLHRVQDRWPLSRAQAAFIAVLGLSTPVLMYAAGVFGAAKSLSAWLLGPLTAGFSNSINFTSDYLTAAAFVVHLYGMYWLRLRLPSWLMSLSRWGASIAFSLYLFHMPVLQILKRWLGPNSASTAGVFGAIALMLLVCWLLALVTEQKRALLKRLL